MSIKQITFNRDEGTITYGDYTTKLRNGATIGNVDISNTELTDIDENKNNSILTIKIPVYNSLLKNQDFGINVIYQYDSRRSSIASIDITNYLEAPRKLYLFGSDNMISYSSSTFEDPGFIIVSDDGTMVTYTEIDSNGHIIESDTNLEIDYSGLGSTVGIKYPIVYTIHNPESDYIVTRYVTKINQVNKYAYTGSNQTFTAPIKGIYKIELWGAGGASVDTNLGGHGGYTSGTISLDKDSVINIMIGSAGSGITGGYNGGGSSLSANNSSGGGGGGATDIRNGGTSLSNRILIAAGGGGAGTSTTGGSNGGAGGGIIGYDGNYSQITYNGKGGTSTAGGLAATYPTGVSPLATDGTLGIGGTGGKYVNGSTSYSGGGGGGGYYGGGGGSSFGAGGGGSSYCSISSCIIYDGLTSFSNPTSLGTEVGHNGNGYAKITLITIVN